MRKPYIEINGQLYKEIWYEDNSGPLSLIRKGYVRSRRRNYKNSLRYKLWYHMPEIIDIGYQITFAVCAVAMAAITIGTFIAMWNALV